MNPILQVVLFLLTTFVGSTIQAVSGFGFAIFVMMIFPFLFPTAICATLSSMLAITSSTINSIRMRRHLHFKRILLPLIAYFIASTIAIRLSTVSPAEVLKKCLAVVMILLSIYFIFFSKKLKIRPTPTAGLISGTLSGILGGFFSMSGPPIVVYLLSASEDNDSYLADIQTFFCITNIYSTIVRAINGLIQPQHFAWWAIGAAAMVGGIAVGKIVFSKLDGAMLKRVVYGVMAASGMIMLLT